MVVKKSVWAHEASVSFEGGLYNDNEQGPKDNQLQNVKFYNKKCLDPRADICRFLTL